MKTILISQKNISKVASDERVKDEIMDIFYDTPFYGVPRLTAELKRRGLNMTSALPNFINSQAAGMNNYSSLE